MIEKYKKMPIQVRASIWFLICGFLQKAIIALTTPIFTRLMSTDVFGQYSVYNSWYLILNIIISLNLCGGFFMQGLVKFDKKEEFTSSLLGLTSVLVVFWFVIYLLFRPYINQFTKLDTFKMLIMFITILLNATFNFWAICQRVEYLYIKLVVVTLIITIGGPVLGIILFNYMTDKVLARLIGSLVIEFIIYTPLYVKIMTLGRKFYDKSIWLYGLKLGLPLVPHYLAQNILNSADRIMIQKMVGDSESGIYSLAYSLSLMMTLFSSSLLQTIEPWIYKKIKSEDTEDIPNIAYSTLIFVGLINLILILFAPEIVRIFAPSSYYDAIWIIPPVSMSVFFMYMYSFFATFEFYYEKSSYIASGTIIGALLNVVLNYVFINAFGYYAAGYTTLVCYVIYAFMHFLIMDKICKKEINKKIYNNKILLIISIIFVCFGFFVEFLYNYFFMRMIFVGIVFILFIVKRSVFITFMKKIINIRGAE